MILSKDYKKLFEFVMANENCQVPCFVDYHFTVSDHKEVLRDVAAVCYRYKHIDIGVRGYCYGNLSGEDMNENFFVRICEILNLEFVD